MAYRPYTQFARATGFALMIAASAAQADCPLQSTFEGGTLDGWLSGTTGGTGSTKVELHNGSKAAYVQHSAAGSHLLSCDTAYIAGGILEFDLQAIATRDGGTTASSSAGLTVSFLSSLNATLGSMGWFNVNKQSLLGVHDIQIDQSQHHYANSMNALAGQAGLSASAPIARISLSFVGTGLGVVGFGASHASVWFDNVQVAAVPEPSKSRLTIFGLAAVLLAMRIKTNPQV